MTPEDALRDIQRLIQRKPSDTEASVLRMRLPADLATSEHHVLGILADEMEAAENATTALLGDQRFEHLQKPSDDIWRFVAECWADKSTDHVAAFVARHAAEVTQAVCYIPIEYLTVKDERRLPEIALLPVSDSRIPPAHPWFALDKPTGCVAAVPVSGSDYGKMADRARDQTRYLLRGLRVALGGRVHKRQLRFRLGIGYAFDKKLTGWDRRDDEAYDVELRKDVLTDLLSNPVMAVPAEPGNDLERKATLAMTWMERACMTGDDLVALLYRFFALEAMLGDKSEGLKAHGLAFREMMLSHIVTADSPTQTGPSSSTTKSGMQPYTAKTRPPSPQKKPPSSNGRFATPSPTTSS